MRFESGEEVGLDFGGFEDVLRARRVDDIMGCGFFSKV